MTALGSRRYQTTTRIKLVGNAKPGRLVETGGDAWETIPCSQLDSKLAGFSVGVFVKILVLFDRLERIWAAEGIQQPNK